MSQPTPDGAPIGGYPTAEPYDETDVPAALERTTQDGPGEEDPGPSDWNGYATDGVEKDADR